MTHCAEKYNQKGGGLLLYAPPRVLRFRLRHYTYGMAKGDCHSHPRSGLPSLFLDEPPLWSPSSLNKTETGTSKYFDRDPIL